MHRLASTGRWAGALTASLLLHVAATLPDRVVSRRATAEPTPTPIEVALVIEQSASPLPPTPVQKAEPPNASPPPKLPKPTPPPPETVEQPAVESEPAEPPEALEAVDDPLPEPVIMAAQAGTREPAVSGSSDRAARWLKGSARTKRRSKGRARRVNGGSTGTRLTALADLSRPPSPESDMRALLQKNTPEKARRLGLEGHAKVSAVILPNGRVGSTRVLAESRGAAFGAACVSALRASRWRAPLDKRRHAVAVRIIYVCRFVVVN